MITGASGVPAGLAGELPESRLPEIDRAVRARLRTKT